MKKEELIKHKIYIGRYEDNCDIDFIIKYEGDIDNCPYVTITDGIATPHGRGAFGLSDYSFTEADAQEIEWFNKTVRAGKKIPIYSETYEIY